MHETSQLVGVVAGLIVLLLIAAAVLALSKRIRLPFTVLLVLVGALISFVAERNSALEILHGLSLSPDLILYVFLPTLIFESAFNLNARQLWHNIVPIMTLAVPGLLISTGIIAGILVLATDIPLLPALLLGSILSATDPVAVIALFKQLGAPMRLTILVEGESLFNDATAIVLASILIGAIALDTGGEGIGLVGASMEFFSVFFGGLIVGWLLGISSAILLGKVRADVYIETTLTTILAYASFLIAEQMFHVSGVVAVVAAGLTLGSWGRIKISPSVRHYIDHFWEYMAFVATALIFLMVGMRANLSELWQSSDVLIWVIVGMLLSRAIVIFTMIPLSNQIPGSEPTNRAYQKVMYWGGLRGAIALAIVLSIPEFELSELFVSLVMGAVLFTLLVQGLSIEWLVDKLGLSIAPLSDRIAEAESRVTATQHALKRLPELQSGGLFSGSIASQLQQNCEQTLHAQQMALFHLRSHELDRSQETALLYLRCYANEKAQYNALYNNGHLSEAALRSLLTVLTTQIESVRFKGDYQSIAQNNLPQRRLGKVLLHGCERIPVLSIFTERLRLEHIVISYEEAWGHFRACKAVLNDMEELEVLTQMNKEITQHVRLQYQHWQEAAEISINLMAEQYPEFVSAMQERLGMRLILLAEFDAIEDDNVRGNIPHALAEQIQEQLQQRLWALRGQEITRLRVEPSELLRKIPFFADVLENDFSELTRKMKRHSVDVGEKIIAQGEKGDKLYMIARGVVRVSHESQGKNTNMATLIAGDFFGEMALLHDEPRTASVTSISPCTLYILGREDLHIAMEDNPSIRIALENADKLRREQQALLQRDVSSSDASTLKFN
jgi:monovalent cation:H+ antiporter, CPA1 family